ncbi:uncharacterized protein PY1_contig-08-715 [Novosphingobium sp. PY1]|nr:uncharacterized protein PY1_contig-08-715 [Novosphingobium sp. PY1]
MVPAQMGVASASDKVSASGRVNASDKVNASEKIGARDGAPATGGNQPSATALRRRIVLSQSQTQERPRV